MPVGPGILDITAATFLERIGARLWGGAPTRSQRGFQDVHRRCGWCFEHSRDPKCRWNFLTCLLLLFFLGPIHPSQAAQEVVAWGADFSGLTNLPPEMMHTNLVNVPRDLSNVVAIAAGSYHNLGLQANGNVVCWGSIPYMVPADVSNVVSVAAGNTHSLALKTDGTVAAWGYNSNGQTDAPAGLSNVIAITAGWTHSLALRADGSVVAWGDNRFSQTNVPAGLSNVVALAGGQTHSLALRADGTITAWGNNFSGQTNVPADLTNVVAVASGNYYSLALRADGTVETWGDSSSGQIVVPAGLSNVVAIEAGSIHSLALRADGTVEAWGNNSFRQTNVPRHLSNVVGLAAGQFHNLALVLAPSQSPRPAIVRQPVSFPGSMGDTAVIRVQATGRLPLNYRWQKDGISLTDGGNVLGSVTSTLRLVNLLAGDAGSYSVVISNSFGVVTSAVSLITVNLARLDVPFNPGDATPLYGYPRVTSLAVQTDGKILVVGSFYTLGGQPRNSIGRLNPDGSLDTAFNPDPPSSSLRSLAIQPDGKILLGGDFNSLNTKDRENILRLNADGSLDTNFSPRVRREYINDSISTIVLQPDGKILAGGFFNTLGGENRKNIGRLHSDGTVDMSFDPGTDSFVSTLALQADGKVLVGGSFTTLGGQPRKNIGRLHPDGTVDMSFDPGTDSLVSTLALQPDGKILVGGSFTTLGGQPRKNIGRLHPDGTVDMSFNPGADDAVHTLALQTDGRILVGGSFTTLAGQPRDFMGRLNPDGSVDPGFLTAPSGNDNYTAVYALGVQPDGKVLVGGCFSKLGGLTRNYIGRLCSSGPATQNLDYDGDTLTWLRTGTSPEVWHTAFAYSLNNTNWIPVGTGTRVMGGWQLTGISLPVGSSVRAQGHVTGSGNGSSWFVEDMIQVAPGPPLILTQSADQTFTAGDTVCFSVRAVGFPPLFYQWRKNGTNLLDGSHISGAVSSNLCLVPLQATDAGWYSLVVANNYGSTTSSIAMLTVLTNTIILNQPVSQTCIAGDTVCFSVHAVGLPPLIYQWRKNGTNLLDGSRTSGVTTSNLCVSFVQPSDAGVYSVVISNISGNVSSSNATLSVLTPPPAIITQPIGQSVRFGGSLLLSIQANGAQPLACQWFKDGIPLDDTWRLIGTHASDLRLNNATVDDSGQYWVVVSNSFGTTTSIPATVAV